MYQCNPLVYSPSKPVKPTSSTQYRGQQDNWCINSKQWLHMGEFHTQQPSLIPLPLTTGPKSNQDVSSWDTVNTSRLLKQVWPKPGSSTLEFISNNWSLLFKGFGFLCLPVDFGRWRSRSSKSSRSWCFCRSFQASNWPNNSDSRFLCIHHHFQKLK